MKNNKGKSLERKINKANYQYRKDGIAMIKKEEVPILVTKRGLQATLSTVDYTGAVKFKITNTHHVGLFIAFDAKECSSKTSFPLKNIHQHQLEFLKFHDSLGSCTFFLIQFLRHHEDKAFLVPTSFVNKMWLRGENGGRKSIAYNEFDKNWLVPIDDYLTKIINNE